MSSSALVYWVQTSWFQFVFWGLVWCVFLGGSCIQEESDELIAKQGDLSEGEVVVTGAGSLGCSWILHAVGPTWKGGLKGKIICTCFKGGG